MDLPPLKYVKYNQELNPTKQLQCLRSLSKPEMQMRQYVQKQSSELHLLTRSLMFSKQTPERSNSSQLNIVQNSSEIKGYHNQLKHGVETYMKSRLLGQFVVSKHYTDLRKFRRQQAKGQLEDIDKWID
ncbi:Hypothetical_protein [Hexamita inflata]|uniref:Hypothetical_protein n=1 Tax=Hexamita inflata TaxID=28002 RepID=A0ABP1IL38_9EUKA